MRPVTTEEMERILLDVLNDVPAPRDERPEAAAVRAKLQDEVTAIHNRGGVVEIPPEVP